MAGRGSGIGLSGAAGLGFGGVGGSQTSTRAPTRGAPYGAQATSSKSAGALHHYLWALVLLELVALGALRYLFRDHRGG
jgi:hypothetical protein